MFFVFKNSLSGFLYGSKEYDASGYAKNWKYLTNVSYLGNSTQNISLYLFAF